MDDLEKTIHEQAAICRAAQCTAGLISKVEVDERLIKIEASLRSLQNLLWGLLISFFGLTATAAGAMVFWIMTRGKS